MVPSLARRAFAFWAAVWLMMMWGQAASAFTVVVIDAGHGGKDPGCVWNGLYEKTLCLDVARRVQKLLNGHGLRTVMTRSSDEYLELSARTAISNRQEGAIFVSIHFNASRDRSVAGFEVHYRSKTGAILARSVESGLAKEARGKKREGDWQDYKVLRQTKATAVLVECGFLSNKSEAARCSDPDHRQSLARGIANGILAVRTKL